MKAQSKGTSRASGAAASKGSATQRNSPLAFTCELGPDKLLFHSAHVHEELGRLYEIQVDLTSADLNIAFDSIIGTPASVRLNLSDGAERFFHGIVSHFTLDRVEAHTAHYRATLVPWLWLLTRSADCKIFQHLTVPQIIQQVFRDHGFSDFDTRFTQSYPQWEYCVQYRETAFNFISRLLEYEGIYYFFEHTRDKHTLILCDAPSTHKVPAGYRETLYRPDGDFHATERLTDWRLDEHLQTGTYTQTDYNFQKPRTSLRGKSSIPSKHRHAQFEVFDYPGEHEEPSEGSDYSKVRLQELKAQRRTFRGQTSDRRLTTGGLCKIKEFPRKDFNGDHLIIAADYQLADSDYHASHNGSSEEVYTCSFTAIPAKRQFRPARATPKPIIQGIQTAVVVGPKGKEVFLDEHSRVKVQFHWDRYGKMDDNSSCWIRVSQGWAGGTYGGLNFPRIGHEVIVDFEEGDPDRPILTGRVYNAASMPPPSNAGREDSEVRRSRERATAKKQNADEVKTQRDSRKQQAPRNLVNGKPVPAKITKTKSVLSGVETRMDPPKPNPFNDPPTSVVQTFMMSSLKSSSLDGASGSNEITMNDAGGIEGLFVKAQKDNINTIGNDRETTVKNDDLECVGNDRVKTIGNDETVEIGNSRLKSVGRDESVQIGHDYTKTVLNNEDIEIGNDRTKNVLGDERNRICGNRSKHVDCDETTGINGSRDEIVSQNENITIMGYRTHLVFKDETLKTGANKREISGNSLQIGAGTSVKVAAGINCDINNENLDGPAFLELHKDKRAQLRAINKIKICTGPIGEILLECGICTISLDGKSNEIALTVGTSKILLSEKGIKVSGIRIDLDAP